MKKTSGMILLFILCAFMLCRMPVFAWGFSDDNYYDEYYYGDEPDITDGDLEDKLGDWNLYEDMFPEDYDDYDEDVDYSYSYTTPRKTYKYIDESTTDYYYTGTSCGNENKPYYKKDIKKPQVYSGGKWVKRTNWDDNAWKPKYVEDWYYYPVGSTESLKLTWAYIDNALYFFDRYGIMIHDTYNWLDGKTYRADSNGACTLLTKW